MERFTNRSLKRELDYLKGRGVTDNLRAPECGQNTGHILRYGLCLFLDSNLQLEPELQSDLDIPGTACPNHRICCRYVRRAEYKAERGRIGRVDESLRIGISKVRMVQDVEELSPQLETDALAEFGVFND